MMHRRDLMQSTVTMGAVSMLGDAATASGAPAQPAKIVDTNISLFQWPFRRLPLDQTDSLLKKLRQLGITEAWVGSFEGLLHRDIAGVNDRLAKACQRFPELVAIGSINPTLPDWEEDLRICFDRHQMPGIRLHPSYHGYTLADAAFGGVLKRVADAGRFVQLAVAMEDTRTQHPMLQVPDVDLAPLSHWKQRFPEIRLQLLNYRPQTAQLAKLADVPGLFFDTSRADGTDGVAKLIQSLSEQRVMFGTHSPFLIPEAALIRARESNLKAHELRSLMSAASDAFIERSETR